MSISGIRTPRPFQPTIERQELYCHRCRRYVQFDLDLSLNGNHVLKCPVCGHEHCRVVEDGQITGDRWDDRNGQTIRVSLATAATSAVSTYSTYSAAASTCGSTFTYQAWASIVT